MTLVWWCALARCTTRVRWHLPRTNNAGGRDHSVITNLDHPRRCRQTEWFAELTSTEHPV